MRTDKPRVIAAVIVSALSGAGICVFGIVVPGRGGSLLDGLWCAVIPVALLLAATEREKVTEGKRPPRLSGAVLALCAVCLVVGALACACARWLLPDVLYAGDAPLSLFMPAGLLVAGISALGFAWYLSKGADGPEGTENAPGAASEPTPESGRLTAPLVICSLAFSLGIALAAAVPGAPVGSALPWALANGSLVATVTLATLLSCERVLRGAPEPQVVVVPAEPEVVVVEKEKIVPVEVSAPLKIRCQKTAERYALSKRELDVLELLVQRNTRQRISDILGVSLPTVNSHVQHIYQKTGVHSMQALIDLVRSIS